MTNHVATGQKEGKRVSGLGIVGAAALAMLLSSGTGHAADTGGWRACQGASSSTARQRMLVFLPYDFANLMRSDPDECYQPRIYYSGKWFYGDWYCGTGDFISEMNSYWQWHAATRTWTYVQNHAPDSDQGWNGLQYFGGTGTRYYIILKVAHREANGFSYSNVDLGSCLFN